MNGRNDSFYYFITGVSLLLSVMGLWFTALIPGINRWSKRFFLSYFIVLLLSSVCVLVELVLRYYPVSWVAIWSLLLLETLLLSLPLPMQTAYLLRLCGENLRTSKLLRTVLGLWAVFFILLVSIPFIDGFVYFTPEYGYTHGPLYPLFLAPSIAVLLLNFSGTLRRRTLLSRKAFLSFIIAQAPMAITLMVNLFADAEPIFDISYVLSALSMYSLILSDQIEQDRRHQQEIVGQQLEIARQQTEIAEQQREIAHQRASVMVLQMRPHFIYNTLMTIHSLCSLDPRKAQQITEDFTNYLRRNFNAVASDSAIPFSTELEHTRAYLTVEQAQHEDMLIVEYDTSFTHFRLPPLTLQPIVENAVKHGMNPYAGPLRILIQTRHTDTTAEIIVEDTGSGFDPSDESTPHATLTNIRQRLQMMCHGEMTITSREEGGTVVKVTIPG